jgi:hypothetical protein
VSFISRPLAERGPGGVDVRGGAQPASSVADDLR